MCGLPCRTGGAGRHGVRPTNRAAAAFATAQTQARIPLAARALFLLVAAESTPRPCANLRVRPARRLAVRKARTPPLLRLHAAIAAVLEDSLRRIPYLSQSGGMNVNAIPPTRHATVHETGSYIERIPGS